MCVLNKNIATWHFPLSHSVSYSIINSQSIHLEFRIYRQDVSCVYNPYFDSCPVDGCEMTFTLTQNLNRHIKRTHQEQRLLTVSNSTQLQRNLEFGIQDGRSGCYLIYTIHMYRCSLLWVCFVQDTKTISGHNVRPIFDDIPNGNG